MPSPNTADDGRRLPDEVIGLLRMLDDAGLSPIERMRLNRELAGLGKELLSAPAVIRRMQINKRLGEIRKMLGDAVMARKPEPEPDPDAEMAGVPAIGGGGKFGLKSGGVKTRERLNGQVMGILARVKADNLKLSDLSAEDVEILQQYSGRGGLTENSLSEYYTPTPVAEATWGLLASNGFANGNVLEPSTGSGVFSATKPRGVVISGSEIEETSSAVAQLLHPEDRITNSSFERYALSVADDTFDAVTGNVPFGPRNKTIAQDPAHRGEKRMERYFVRRVIDKVRPGGLIALIVPVAVIGAKNAGWSRWRAEVSMHAEFLGGHKLPSKTFGKQGTDVVTDIIVLRKHPAGLADKIAKLSVDALRAANVLWDEWIEGRYFQGEGARFIHGTFVPGDPDAYRKEDKVIAPDNLDDAGLKARLAVQFDSRIDFAALDAMPEPVQAYADGDRKVINGQQMELKDGRWVPFVATDPADTVLDAAAMGASSLSELEGMLSTSEGMLSMTAEQAFKCWKRYPHLFNGVQAQAVEFAMSQPAEKYREVAYRGSLLGALVQKYGMGEDATDRDRVIQLLRDEVEKYGHPSTIGGMVLDGAKAQAFGVYLSNVNSKGEVSALVRGTVENARGYEADNILSIVTHLGRQSADMIEVPAIAALYRGPIKLQALGDVADVDGVAITPFGEITTTAAYASGDVYTKVAELQSAIGGAAEPRVKAHWSRLIELLMSKVKRTEVDAISFGLRDNWIAASYKQEFFRINGYNSLRYVAAAAEDAEDEMGEGAEVAAARQGGSWAVGFGADEFTKQLTHYLGGKSIGHNLKDRKDSDASERKDEYQGRVNGLEEQFKFFMRAHGDAADLAATYDMTFNRHVTPVYDDAPLGLVGVAGAVKTHGYQNQGVRRLSDEGSGILGYDVGLGKAAPLDAKLMTPQGWRQMGDIKVGDMVFSADGTAVAVTGVFPQGGLEIFEVEFSDGAKTRCCDDHLWFTQTEPDRKAQRYSDRIGAGRSYPGSVKPLKDIRQSLIYQTQKNHRIPMVEPIQHEARRFDVHPYIMGVILGDGSLPEGGNLSFTKGDPHLADRVCNLLREDYGDAMLLKRRGASNGKGRAQCWGFSRGAQSGPNPMLDDLRSMGLAGTLSHTKFIPDAYLLGSVQQRIDLLHGLMDTDGYVSKDGVTVQFTSTSAMLARGMVEIVQSLGGNAWITTKVPTYTYKGEKLKGSLAYTVGMRMPPTINPFSLPRKAERVAPKSKYPPVRFIVAVRSVGVQPAQCISVDHPSRLYVTDDYIVTHNTYSSIAYSLYDRQMGRSKKHCVVVPKSVLANWYNESKKMLGHHNGVLFVGFEPKRDRKGNIVTEQLLDENGQPKRNKHTGEIEIQDVLVEDSSAEVFAKMHSIPAMDGGMVIMTQEKFKSIPLKPETVEAYGDKWVERSMASAASAAKLAGKEVKAGSYAAQQQQALTEQQFYTETAKKKGELPFYEDMGFDRVIVDEAHHYKASFQVKEGLDQLAYLPNPAESQRAQDMALKLSHLRDQNGGKGSILLTATPVANSPIEIYNMLMHVVPPEELDKLGIFTPADFVRFFGVIESVQKLTVKGVVEPRDGLKGFRNLNILRGLFNRYANMMSARDVDPEGTTLKLPMAQEVKSQADMTGEQEDAYVRLRAEAKDSGDKRKVAAKLARPMFAVLRDMDRVTTDMDLYRKTMTFLFKAEDRAKVQALIEALPASIQVEEKDEETGEKVKVAVPKEASFKATEHGITYAPHEGFEYAVVSSLKKFGIGFVSHPMTPKYAELVKNLKAELATKGKQLIFTEEKSQHGKLARLLTESLPVELARIGTINADTASGEKLQEIVDAYTRGDFNIVICNKKAEVGVNLQAGTTAVHHMTLPWTPASIQQRNGRAVRQGNTVASVRIYYYQAKGSFDEYRLDLLNKKANWIGALLSKDNTDDEHDNEDAGNEAEQAALLSENREEFLAKLAAEAAKKEAEAKERRDAAAKTGLMQLGAARMFLATFEARKAKAIAEAQEELDKGIKSLRAAEGLPDTDEKKQQTIDRRRMNVKWLEKKLADVAPKMDQKRSDAEARARQVAGTLKAQAGRGELPFSVALVDTPDEALVSLNKVVAYKGGVYEAPNDRGGNDTFRITAVNLPARKVTVEYLAFGNRSRRGYDGEFDFDKLLGQTGREVHMAPDEVEALKMLKEAIGYSNIAAKMDKAMFLKLRDRITINGAALQRPAGGVLKVEWAGTGETDVVYPDRGDEGLRKEVAAMYSASLSGNSDSGMYGESRSVVMRAIFGDSWQTAIAEYVKVGAKDDARAKMVEFIRTIVPAVLTTMDQAKAADAALGAITGYGAGQSDGANYVRAWATAEGYANVPDMVNWAIEAARPERAAVQVRMRELEEQERQRIAQERARAEAERNQAAMADPRFRELLPDQIERFAALHISAKFNNGDQVGKFAPFSILAMKDAGSWGKLRTVKDLMKPRFGAQWINAKMVGSGNPYENHWSVPATTNIDALLSFLED